MKVRGFCFDHPRSRHLQTAKRTPLPDEPFTRSLETSTAPRGAIDAKMITTHAETCAGVAVCNDGCAGQYGLDLNRDNTCLFSEEGEVTAPLREGRSRRFLCLWHGHLPISLPGRLVKFVFYKFEAVAFVEWTADNVVPEDLDLQRPFERKCVIHEGLSVSSSM